MNLYFSTRPVSCAFTIWLIRATPKPLNFIETLNKCLSQTMCSPSLCRLPEVRGMRRENVLNFLKDLSLVPRVEVVWVGEMLHGQAMALLENRLDKTYSLCDAVSFVVMRERGYLAALTTDKHFEQEGFIRLLES